MLTGRAGAMRAGSQIVACALIKFDGEMTTAIDNVIRFPLHRRREVRGCPNCGKRDDIWQIGRLLWGYCENHELRWVVADYEGVSRATINRREMREGLQFLATFVEVSR